MSTYDNDDDIEFDFFDEPETVEATQRGRRLQRRDRGGDGGGEGPRRPPMQTPTGLVPLARLVGLIAIAIAVVVALVFWVGACQGKNKHADYAAYAAKVNTIAQSSSRLGVKFANRLTAPGLKEADLEQSLQQYAQQEQQAYDQAQQIRAPGPLRRIHQHLVDALELRAKGLAGPRRRALADRRREGRLDRRRDPHREGAAADRERRRLGRALQAAREPAAGDARHHRRRHPRIALRHEHGSRERTLVQPAVRAPAPPPPSAARRPASTATGSSRSRGRRTPPMPPPCRRRRRRK